MHDPQQAQQQIISDFDLFDNWLDRYQYLIDLGKALEPLAIEEKDRKSVV
jgi:cysteine desulfuration protein SufE